MSSKLVFFEHPNHNFIVNREDISNIIVIRSQRGIDLVAISLMSNPQYPRYLEIPHDLPHKIKQEIIAILYKKLSLCNTENDIHIEFKSVLEDALEAFGTAYNIEMPKDETYKPNKKSKQKAKEVIYKEDDFDFLK